MTVDEALLALWECGLAQVTSATDRIFGRDMATARRALLLPVGTQVRSPDYWQERAGMDRAEFDRLLRELEISQRGLSRRLPSGAVRRIRSAIQSRRPAVEVMEASPVCVPVVLSEEEPLSWDVVGTQTPRRYLTDEEIERIHWAIAEDFKKVDDPIYPAGVRDKNLLSSAANRPQTSLGNDAKYPTVEMAGAALLHSLVLNHPFHNGNKRTALVALLVFLDENGYWLTCKQNELFQFVLQLAKHALVKETSDRADREVLSAAHWIRARDRQLDKTERPIKWWRLRHILLEYGCEFSNPNTGNRINISRRVERKSRFSRPRPFVLSTQVHYSDEGSEADRSVVARVRHDLELEPANGVDSAIFYGKADRIDEWIDTYRGTLRRLAKL